ncbi:MAG: A/G-specific adenine glycosylase [Bacteroidales bacterium]|nr:A/G-specific adenine glycosylase [Bacteroidales bacterium]
MNDYFTEKIESWYDDNKRELPWRDTHDAYLIWISEIILQQTRVAQGYDYYLRFVRRFPDVLSLARATEDEVLLMWQGLGYYSRARNLHRAAKMICGMDAFPNTYDQIRSLPGVGDYTAAAIASFAFGEAKAVLDGNVYRVLSRYLGIDTPIDSTQGKKEFRALADEMLDTHHPALYNQAIMDFGAMMCTPSANCMECPLAESCHAREHDRVSELPVKSRKTSVQKLHLIYIYCRAKGHILLRRRGKNDIWKGLYEPLTANRQSTEATDKGVLQWLKDKRTTTLKRGVKHQLTHRLITADFHLLQLDSMDEMPPEWMKENGYEWIAEDQRDAFATSRLVQELYKIVSLHDENL